ncbi:hypothetical protein SAMN02745146_1193 [Hymenobacter daecheongensis DSM 21074]|uniref:Uncharacterized protein n=1 Tax=Hymenobacter daecheongensis DSM 21074 TaxID=1121955 RepID=A0A1M6CLM8_9BACT|nr:hypothetical protein [Hymenobacter daecheongensis]SHI61751.1 hypothetical protein SAMN02745146_1193 [Hymenobacter daecheongensis DSM 21074]
MRAVAFAVLFVLATACSAPDSAQTTGPTPPSEAPAAAEPLDTARAPAVTAQSDTLKVVRRRHLFSSPTTPDVFTLALRGSSLLGGEATLTITDGSGQVIFREVLSAADLEASLVYEMKQSTATATEREAFVRKRMDEFFADKNFRTPAISPQQAYQPGTLDRAAWDELRRQPKTIGFQYLVGKEDARRVVWSPLKKQVVQLPGFGG